MTTKQTDAVAAAYRTIHEADPAVAEQTARLRSLYTQVGDAEAGEVAIAEMLEGGPGAAARLRATAETVARVHHLKED